ncbi:EAL domain-containing protein [Alginatibacterium sediminis]|nr:EAL domain-containing protein [Alginatibacterium sediminis]
MILSLIVGLSLPIGYAFVAYNDLSGELNFKVKIKSNSQSELITTMPDTWMYAENRIQGILKREPIVLENEFLQVYDSQGDLITSSGHPVDSLKMIRSYPLYDIDSIVGRIDISKSLSQLIANTLMVGLFGLILGFMVMVVMRLLPIRQVRKISDQLFEEKDRAEITLHSISDAVIRCDLQTNILFANDAAETLLERPFEQMKGLPIADVLNLRNKSGDRHPLVIDTVLATRAEASCEGQSFLDVNNKVVAIEERAAPIFSHNQEMTGVVLCIRDVTIARNYLEQRSWEASHDSLTSLLNRRAFEQKVSKAIERSKQGKHRFVLCFMDLDRFKVVNDSCGHAAGDELLMQITQLMESQVREGDVLARLGGDEFGLLIDGCDTTQGELICNEIVDQISSFQFFWMKRVYTVGISIGLTNITRDTPDTSAVLSEADSACYWAKENGRNQVCVFLPSDTELAANRNQSHWVERIESALKDNRFVLYQQSYRSLNGDQTERLHMEILLRMLDESHALILPQFFLPAAERYDLIQQIDRWVIDKVFADFQQLTDEYQDCSLMVSINLSGASINTGNLLPFIESKVAQYGVDPCSICFEVTETVAVKNLLAATVFINECKTIGFKFALDDFGTGVSSFEYLKKLPVDYLKIDGSFVQNIDTNQIDREMAATINRIAHLLGKLTVAEYAESEDIVDVLDTLGVDYAQGYGVCLPKPLFNDSYKISL